MIEPLSAWKARLLAMPQVNTQVAGAQNLANFYGDKADLVQADSPDGSTVGIFTFNRPLFVSKLLSLGFGPVADTSWVSPIGEAWETAVAGSAIAASTVTFSAWTASGNKDTETQSTGAQVITNLSACRGILENGLLAAGTPFVANTVNTVGQADFYTEQFAKAWRDATLAFLFECRGQILATPLPPVTDGQIFPAK